MSKRPDNKALTVWIIIGLAVAAAVIFMLLPQGEEALCAVVSIDGEDIAAVDLSNLERRSYSLESYGVGISLLTENGQICFLNSTCPDKICINSGWLSRDMDIDVCMPNRTSVIVMPKSSADTSLTVW